MGDPMLKDLKGVLGKKKYVPRLNCKAKISYFGLATLHEYIGGFDIPVDDVFGMKIIQTFKKLFYNRPGLILAQSPSFLYFLSQCASLAQLRKAVAELRCFKDIVALDDMPVGECEQNLNLLLQQFKHLGIRVEIQIYDLGCYFLPWVFGNVLVVLEMASWTTE